MLIEDFYVVEEMISMADECKAKIKLNPDHAVYKGHFPNNPVLPGVIQLQIIKEILEESLGKKIFLHNVNSVKYLRIITPEQTCTLEITVKHKKTDESNYKINALIGSNGVVFTKLIAQVK